MRTTSLFTVCAMAALLSCGAAAAQEGPVPSQCLAMAQSMPGITYANFTPAQVESGVVTITYAGHSTYVIETPAGVRVATDYSGVYGTNPVPDIVTMNKAHTTHYTDFINPEIDHVLRGWNPEGGAASHALVVDDIYIRNVPTDIRRGAWMEENGNSIFIFEVAGLCIGHLGHLHHALTDAHYAAIGRLDIVMVPVDGGLTLSADAMTGIVKRLFSSLVLPMHRNFTPLSEFTSRMSAEFALEYMDGNSFTVSLRDLPRRPTVRIPSRL
ncbi:MAG: MBL fold metallo-hydrolase [Rhizobiaceae bacterium]|nr:MBL fold metallo-hydrolase [Rhizobiaceae bacterium]